MAFPQLASESSGSQTSNTTSHSVTLPATVPAGALLRIAMSFDGNPTVTWDNSTAGAWTLLRQGNNGSICKLVNYVKVADGTEGGLTLTIATSASEQSVYRAVAYTNWEGTIGGGVAVVATAATGASATPNPPALTTGWGAVDTLFIEVVGVDNGNRSVTAASANYTNLFSDASGGTAGVVLGSARRELTADSDDPGTMTLSASDDWVAVTIAIRGSNLSTATGSHAGSWSVRNSQTGSKAGAWSVRNEATGSRAGSWSVRNGATGSASGAWSIRNSATGSYAAAWSVDGLSNATGGYSSAWSVRNSTTGAASGAWSVRNAQTGSYSAAWSIQGLMSASAAFAGAWSVANQSQGSHAGAWSVRASEAGAYSGAWSIRNAATGAHSGAWSVDGLANATGSYSGGWSVRNTAEGAYVGAWSVAGDVAPPPSAGGAAMKARPAWRPAMPPVEWVPLEDDEALVLANAL